MNSLTAHSKQHDHLVIIGSGPVGMTAALLFKDHFKRITLLERQSKESFLEKGGFTFPVVFSPSSIRILKEIGAWNAIEAERSEFFGVVVNTRILGMDFQFKTIEEDTYSHWRTHLITSLFNRVQEEGIKIHFGSRVVGIDFEKQVCNETMLGDLDFDLLLGADGINSQTRDLMSFSHPDFAPEDFRLIFLDRWYAYRLPAHEGLKKKFGGGARHLASNVFVNNLKQYPREKFRVVTTHMRQPKEEISVLIKYEDSLDLQRVEELNEVFIGPYFDSKKQLKAAWDMGYGDKFEQVETPTFRLGNALLIGDAAHGFESTGDLINLGLTSIGALVEMIKSGNDIPSTLKEYDQTIGENLRFYARYALRRSYEKIGFEVGSIEIASRLGLANRHPGLFGIYADDFEIQQGMDQYRRDKRNSALLVLGLALIPIILVGWILF